jgi:hypothetical protein
MTQSALWITAGGFAAVAGVAFVADHRRVNRRDLDRVGWMPWNFVQILAMIAAIAAAALAVRA